MWCNWNLLYSVDYDSLASPDADKIKYPFRTVGRDFQLLGSCHGLVCIRLFDDKGRTDCICLWNPATKQYPNHQRNLIPAMYVLLGMIARLMIISWQLVYMLLEAMFILRSNSIRYHQIHGKQGKPYLTGFLTVKVLE